MTIKLDTIKRLYLLVAVFYYCGFMGFTTRLFTGKAEGSIESTASGNIVKQVLGIEILLLGILLLFFLKPGKLKSVALNNKIWVVLLLFLSFSVLWSDIQGVSLRRLVAFTTLVICSLVIAMSFELKSLLLYLSNAIFIAAFIGLLLVIVAPNIAITDQVGAGRMNTFFGIYFDKNAGARCYAYALLIRIGYGKLYDQVDILKLVTLGLCVVLANSATAVVMVVIGSSALLILNSLHTQNYKRNLKRVFLVIFLAILASIIINYLYVFLLELLGRDPTLTNRALIWELIIPFINDKFFLGYGFGGFWASETALKFVERWGFIGNAHSGYLEAMLNGGVLCLVLVISLILKVTKDCLSIYVNDSNGKVITPVLAIVLIQAIVNYVGYVILNYNSADTFFFTTLSFGASYYLMKRLKS